ncbi:MAG: HU family DNA-binding protein [Deltaproteobacteria bacterium]|nr:HU family DNA-binding protein [Deltaproteobacteria bacterium]
MKRYTSGLTRSELIQTLRRRLSVSGRDASDIIETFIEIISDALQAGGSVSISGLGKFKTSQTPARPGRNPKTGEPFVVPAKTRLSFGMSKTFRSALERSRSEGFDQTAGTWTETEAFPSDAEGENDDDVL